MYLDLKRDLRHFGFTPVMRRRPSLCSPHAPVSTDCAWADGAHSCELLTNHVRVRLSTRSN